MAPEHLASRPSMLRPLPHTGDARRGGRGGAGRAGALLQLRFHATWATSVHLVYAAGALAFVGTLACARRARARRSPAYQSALLATGSRVYAAADARAPAQVLRGWPGLAAGILAPRCWRPARRVACADGGRSATRRCACCWARRASFWRSWPGPGCSRRKRPVPRVGCCAVLGRRARRWRPSPSASPPRPRRGPADAGGLAALVLALTFAIAGLRRHRRPGAGAGLGGRPLAAGFGLLRVLGARPRPRAGCMSASPSSSLRRSSAARRASTSLLVAAAC